MDPVTIGIVIGIVTLVIERVFAYGKKIKQSSCCGVVIEREV